MSEKKLRKSDAYLLNDWERLSDLPGWECWRCKCETEVIYHNEKMMHDDSYGKKQKKYAWIFTGLIAIPINKHDEFLCPKCFLLKFETPDRCPFCKKSDFSVKLLPDNAPESWGGRDFLECNRCGLWLPPSRINPRPEKNYNQPKEHGDE